MLALKQIQRILKPNGKLIISIPAKHSLVRDLQKWARFLVRLFGKDKYSYLGVSKYEVDPKKLTALMNDSGFIMVEASKFDPIIPNLLLKFLRPSLLVLEVRKFS